MACNNEPAGIQPVFAFLSNVESVSSLGPINAVTLDTLDIDFPLFQYLFFSTPGKNFHIAKANIDYCLFNFNNLTLNGNVLSLLEVFLSTYENVNFTNRNYLSPHTYISAIKQIGKYKNLVSVLPYLTALSYSDLVGTLVDSLIIEPALNSSAIVTVLLSSKIYLNSLDTTITINLPITTTIPGYANVYDGSSPNFKPAKPIANSYSLEEKVSGTEEKISENFKIDNIVSLGDSDDSLAPSENGNDETAW